MNAMDHGPFVTATIAADPYSTKSIIAYKGIAIKVSPDAVMVFDTDLLRMASAWTGGFLKWYPGRDGLQEFPSPDGFTHFSTSQRPGWSLDGKFGDPRPWGYGPIPPGLGVYKGLYLQEGNVVLSYSIGSSEILESPGFETSLDRPLFTRTFNLSPTSESLSLQIAQTPDGAATSLQSTSLSATTGFIRIQSGGHSRLIGYNSLPDGASWRIDHAHLILDLPPIDHPLAFTLALGPIATDDSDRFLVDCQSLKNAPANLASATEPGQSQWPAQTTQIRRGDASTAFANDELTAPSDNPWNSFLRFSGVDFLPDGRAVLSSLSGEVWLVDGLEPGNDTLRWTRFATGLFQPMGIKVVDDQVYVTGRDQITRLHDRNNDGEADFYENFNNEVMVSTNFHAFTLNLDTDSKGNFYFAKATPWPPVPKGVPAEIIPHHGALFRMPPDGSRLDVIATGLRNPNGLSIGPNDEILYSDNEGNWVPTSKVHRIQVNGFHGFRPSAQRSQPPADFVKPIAWIPHFIDNSPSAPIFIDSPAWPESLQGQALLASYGRGTLSLLLNEDVDGQWQAAHLPLPITLQSGAIHGRFHADGNLYLAGLTSWQSVGHGGDWGSFHRVRYTGNPLHLPVAVNTLKGGIELRFAEPLNPNSAIEPGNFSLSQWTYPWTSQYGTRGKVYSANRPGEAGPDPVAIRSILLSSDRTTLTLEIPELRQSLVQRSVSKQSGLPDLVETPMGLVMAISYRLQSADGAAMNHLVHKTIHRVPGDTIDPSETKMPIGHSSHSPPSEAPAVPKTARNAPTATADRVIDIRSTGITLTYDVTEVRMKTGEQIALRYTNASDMVHNLVIVNAEADINPVGIAALTAPQDAFIPSAEKDRILAASELAYPGDTVTVEFTASEPGVHPYICTYSGHFTMMQGRIIVEP